MARAKKIKPIDLSAAVNELLKEYGDAVFDAVSESVEEVTDEATDKLRQVNHFAPGGNPSGAYARSWVNDAVRRTRVSTAKVVHNEEHYRLTHLLENGHVIRNGTGRTFGRTGKYQHIAPVNDWAKEELPKRFRQKVSK